MPGPLAREEAILYNYNSFLIISTIVVIENVMNRRYQQKLQ